METLEVEKGIFMCFKCTGNLIFDKESQKCIEIDDSSYTSGTSVVIIVLSVVLCAAVILFTVIGAIKIYKNKIELKVN